MTLPSKLERDLTNYKGALELAGRALLILERQRVGQRRKCPLCKRIAHEPNCGILRGLRESS